jgi:hypothetical protein
MVLKDERLQQILSDIDASKDPEKVRGAFLCFFWQVLLSHCLSYQASNRRICNPQFLEQKLSKDPAFEAFADQVLKSLQVQP